MKLLELGCVALGGSIGAVLRYAISKTILELRPSAPFPWGTLAVNVLGCFLLGLLMTLIHERGVFRPELRLALTTGLLGALTTFSTFGYETLRLAEKESLTMAALNVGANLTVGFLAVALGGLCASRLGPLLLGGE